jgi:predicted PurR-regulated permease PerM
MWYWIIKVSILSLIFIFLIHYLYSFFISTLTVPKVKDLVTLPQEKYNEMFQSLQQQQQASQPRINESSNSTQSMKEDLIHFLKEIGSSNESIPPPASSSFYNSNINSNSFAFDSNISSFSFSK